MRVGKGVERQLGHELQLIPSSKGSRTSWRQNMRHVHNVTATQKPPFGGVCESLYHFLLYCSLLVIAVRDRIRLPTGCPKSDKRRSNLTMREYD
jgi:hypothetical protein